MAECIHDQLTVTGAGRTSMNGTYQKAGTEVYGGVTFSIYTKDGNPASLPAVKVVFSAGPGLGSWAIYDTIPVFGTTTIYHDNNYVIPNSIPSCPIDLTYIPLSGPWGGSTYAPAPTVTAGGGESAPTFGLPADVVALITARFGTVANFLRLRNQGQV